MLSRASTVARVVPPLAQVLGRAFTASATPLGGGKHQRPRFGMSKPGDRERGGQPGRFDRRDRDRDSDRPVESYEHSGQRSFEKRGNGNGNAYESRGQRFDRRDGGGGGGGYAQRNQRFERGDREERGGRFERDDRFSRGDREDRGDRFQKNDRFEARGDRFQKTDRFESRGDKFQKNDRFESRGERFQKNDRFESRGDRFQKEDRFEAPGRTEQTLAPVESFGDGPLILDKPIHPRDRQQAGPREFPVPKDQATVDRAKRRDFAEFGIRADLLEALGQKFVNGKTTPVQSLAWSSDLMKEPNPAKGPHRAILGAETGSGKTHAYLVPVMQHLKATDNVDSASTAPKGANVQPRALVLQPTHELTRQSAAMAKSFTHHAKLSVVGASTGNYTSVRRAGRIDMLFATATTCKNLLFPQEEANKEASKEASKEAATETHEEGEQEEVEDNSWPPKKEVVKPPHLDFSRLDWLVLDETDVLLGDAFKEETDAIIERVRAEAPNCNILLVTATLSPALLESIKTNDLLSQKPFAKHLSPGLHQLPTNLETRFVPWSKRGTALTDVAAEVKRGFAEDAMDEKLAADREGAGLLNSKSKAVVFVGTAKKAEQMVKTLLSRDIPTIAWTSDAMSEFKGPKSKSPIRSFLVSHKPERAAVPESPAATETAAAQDENVEPRVLVTTSMLSRGLDFSPAVSSIYLVDPPRNVLDFVHRAGRTARGGYHGRVTLFGLANFSQVRYGDALKGIVRKVSTRQAIVPGARRPDARMAQLRAFKNRQ